MSELVLIVDDEALIAYDIAETVQSCGFQVLGPATSLTEASALIERQKPQVALLDIDVAGDLVWPLARRLVTLGCKPVFISANQTHSELHNEFCGCATVDKPASHDEIQDVLEITISPTQAV